MKYKKTEIENIEVGIDDMEKIVCLSFSNASNSIVKELSDEKKRKSCEKSKRICKEIYKMVSLAC